MDFHAFVTVWALSAIGLCLCQNDLSLDAPPHGESGQSVKFTVTNPPPLPFVVVTWKFNGTTIVILTEAGEKPDGGYAGRVTVDKTTGSLELRNLALNDTGDYAVDILTPSSYTGSKSLKVFEKISNVRAEADQNELVEFNNSVTLTCSASGTSPSFRWYNRSIIVTGSDRVLQRNLTISNVTRYDDGPFQCEASNAISDQMKSNQVKLTIYSGPDSAVVKLPPGGPIYSSGSDITLACSSESNPAAQFQWALNGTLLGREGSELRLENVMANQSGAYSCWAHNIETQRYKTSLPQSITVIEKTPPPPLTPRLLSAGAIAGIVIGLIIILAAGSGLAFYFVKKKGKMGAPKPHQARANNGSVELNYADISHFQRKNVQRVDQGNGGNGETLYSGVRLPNSQAGPNSGQGPTYADLNFPSNAAGMRAVRPKGQAPGPPMQVPDDTYAQVKK